MGRSRTGAVAAVIALHVALLAALFRATWVSRGVVEEPVALTLVPLPRFVPAAVQELPAARQPVRNHSITRPLPPTTATPPVSGEPPAAPVDWSEAARRAVAASAVPPDPSPAASVRSGPAAAAATAFGLQPHTAGEQWQGPGGQWVVFGSDRCYQLSGGAPLDPNTPRTGLGVQTYCLDTEGAPRGDLFKDLPAYQKLHPAH